MAPAFTTTGALGGYTTADVPTDPSQRPDLTSEVLVQWVSSQTVREGMVRHGLLQGNMTEEQANQLVGMSFEQYVIAVKGSVVLSMAGGFQKLPRAAFQKSAHLTRRESKEKLYPAGLEIAPEGVAWFYFPRRLPGEPPASPGEDPIEFHWSSPGSSVNFHANAERIKGTFDLSRMVRDGQPDL